MKQIAACILLLLVACNPARNLTLDGDRLREEGKHEDAANNYYSALLKKKDYRAAKEGLKESAQKVLEDKFTTFSRYVVDNKIEEAMKQYRNAERYAANARAVGVELKWPTEYNEVYADVRDEYVVQLYDEVLQMMDRRLFDKAEQQLARIAELDSSYRGATVLRLNTVIEPLYQRGLDQLGRGEFREAYNTFNKVLTLDDHYKDAAALKTQALDKATISVALFPAVNRGSMAEASSWMSAELEHQMLKSKAPFVRVSSSSKLGEELQAKGWGHVRDKRTAAEAAKNLGYKYALLVTIQSSSSEATPFTKTDRTAYESFTESILNPITGTYNYISKFRKARYEDTYEALKVRMSISYELILVSTGATVVEDEFEAEKKDEQHLLHYNGNVNNLYEELPQGNYLPPPNDNWRQQFTLVKRKLRTEAELGRQLCAEAAETITYRVKGKLQ
jgi:hypothetical protein